MIRVYKFLTAEFALEDIRKRRMKISEIDDLNDPFELIACDLSDPVKRMAILAMRDEMAGNQGLVCFSSAWINPVLWAHYSDKHRGICLGLDVNEEVAKRITYSEIRIPWREPDIEFVQEILWTKFAGWRYEEEIRVYASRDEEENGMYFKDFDKGFRLREVVVGHRSCVERGEVAAALTSYIEPVRITKACLSYTSFDVIEDLNGFAS